MIENIAWITLAFVAFAVVHSLTAGVSFPTRLKRMLPPRQVEGWYRLAYTVFSFVTFLPVMALTAFLADSTIYSLSGVAMIALRGLQLVAISGLTWALWSIDFFRFAGLRQAWAYLNGAELPLPDEPLQKRGIYSVMRHPLYVFSLAFLWASPVMTGNGLIFNICATLYFVIGAAIEERRLMSVYGDTYGNYRRDVPWVAVKPNRR
jgi:protein-S-isoprenylcysteine O-methyltransferase Ste14